jgi:hypothetical protein
VTPVHQPINEKEGEPFMQSNPNPNDFVQYTTRKKLDTCVRRAMSSLEHENTVTAATPEAAFQRLLKVYKGLKPLLAFLTTFPLVPQSVRSGIGLLAQTLEAVSEVGGTLTAQFKAGKDLEQAV